MKPTVILQIRTNSTRLPGKMLLPFYEQQTIPDLIIARLMPFLGAEKLVIATTTSPDDDTIAEMAMRHGIRCFRGSEKDVLGRFLGAIDAFQLNTVIRVCADNPFLRAEYIQTLTDAFAGGTYDYATFEFPDGTPIMQSHIGLFAEIMTSDFLRKIDTATADPFFHEHVTNYVYTHRQDFRTLFIPVPPPVSTRRDIRLTIDTRADFDHLASLYSAMVSENPEFTVDELIARIDRTEGLLESMKREIDRNSK
jgi:spore coat polysaccharide biosynthesis protein SpsF (cytidylyltransferase family)